MKKSPVEVSLVAFVCIVFPSFKAPFSTTPPPGVGFLWRAFAPLSTVKFALYIYLISVLFSRDISSRLRTQSTYGSERSLRTEKIERCTYKLISLGFRFTMVGMPK